MPKNRPDRNIEQIEVIKGLIVVAIVSDDDLMERLVLKGGNALDLVHKVSTRASLDFDFSMEDEFAQADLHTIGGKLEDRLKQTFRGAGYQIFDFAFEEKPPDVSEDIAGFWGGYSIDFKVASQAVFDRFSANTEQLRRNAIGRGGFSIDISKFEYVTGKESKDLEGHRLFVYSPAMLVAEKLRAICQQMPEYGPVVHRGRQGASRARDFVDIHDIVTKLSVQMITKEYSDLLRRVFKQKRVPLRLLGLIHEHRDFHRGTFRAVEETVKPGKTLKDFDYYFDHVLSLVDQLQSLWNE